jgi:hypothetical protein
MQTRDQYHWSASEYFQAWGHIHAKAVHFPGPKVWKMTALLSLRLPGCLNIQSGPHNTPVTQTPIYETAWFLRLP